MNNKSILLMFVFGIIIILMPGIVSGSYEGIPYGSAGEVYIMHYLLKTIFWSVGVGICLYSIAKYFEKDK